MIETDVVQSDNPLLMSKATMKKVEMKRVVVNDKAEIFGKGESLKHFIRALEYSTE